MYRDNPCMDNDIGMHTMTNQICVNDTPDMYDDIPGMYDTIIRHEPLP